MSYSSCCFHHIPAGFCSISPGIPGRLFVSEACSRSESVPGLCRVTSLRQRVLAVAAANRHTAVLTDAGAIFSWGSNDQGQLGYGTSDSSSNAVPRQVEAMKVSQHVSHPLTSLSCLAMPCHIMSTIVIYMQRPGLRCNANAVSTVVSKCTKTVSCALSWWPAVVAGQACQCMRLNVGSRSCSSVSSDQVLLRDSVLL